MHEMLAKGCLEDRQRHHQHGPPMLHATGSCLLQHHILHAAQLRQHGIRHRAGQPASGQVGLLLLPLSILHASRGLREPVLLQEPMILVAGVLPLDCSSWQTQSSWMSVLPDSSPQQAWLHRGNKKGTALQEVHLNGPQDTFRCHLQLHKWHNSGPGLTKLRVPAEPVTARARILMTPSKLLGTTCSFRTSTPEPEAFWSCKPIAATCNR